MFDKRINRFRIYAPVSHGVHGLGALGRHGRGGDGLGKLSPHFSISFGGLGAVQPDVITKAHAAVNAINTFASKHAGKPPAVRLPAVHAFQAAEKGLTIDGLYGSNTRAALQYYLPTAKLPAVAPALRGQVTWQPPAAAPVPVQVLPVNGKPTPVILASGGSSSSTVPSSTSSSTVPAPAGYHEVGQEAVNPGFPPVGVETKVGTSKGSTAPQKPAKRPTKPVQRKPVVMLPPPGPGTTQADLTRVVDAAPAGAIVVDKGRLVDVTQQPAQPSQPAQGPYPHVTNWPAEKSEGDDNTWLWIAAGYLYWKKHHKRAA